MTLPRYARFLTLLLAAIQFAAPAVVSVADGAFSKIVRDPGVHVESSGDTECTPPHGADCGVCRYLTSGSTGPVGRGGDLPEAETRSRFIATSQLHGAIVRGATQSRAPPAV